MNGTLHSQHSHAGAVHSHTGRIHSIETFGTVDGPGIRFVLFMQGCALQCQYCHNPDTWDSAKGRVVTVDEILGELEPYLEYYRRSGGGITVTGGEPTLQAAFVAALFTEVKRRWGLHTALDSSGFCEPDHVQELMEVTDLVLLDVKHIDPAKHTALTSQSNERTLHFAELLSAQGKPVWIRHVLVPGLTDGSEDLRKLGAFLGKLTNVEKLELLPYHRMGVYKWQQLGRPYPLEGVAEPDEREVERAKRLIAQGMGGSW
ncbi:pyruvate formate-lyase-activating protein [Paenibacillus doosanensis]|uniref:Pyruvate formate-lyase-activating enzyme n=1 Tax=Paenibacillus konkukensis TaxID=2020716 RepID=A0ABY4RVN5_9BACL|nr:MULTISPECIES: pyruvate formate-lyase-activating protein [Paenibacillus]MCS7460949.1 pyruvate formate-lyase-activating protein [Paenibacillus doosanensis]UQZ85618.1 Pyruvate formate-lyase-activating enzyme [Paenibacillus konkukensis]